MSWRDAPLYIEAHDLACWILDRLASPPREARGVGEIESWLRQRLAGSACNLVTSISLALTFPDRRPLHLRRADETVVRLRTELRLARQAGLLSERGHRHACGRLTVAGRMIGGWRKRFAGRQQPTAREISSFASHPAS